MVTFDAAPANDDGALPDVIVDLFAALELRQREAWARELGLDPRGVDLLALPPVPVARADRASLSA